MSDMLIAAARKAWAEAAVVAPGGRAWRAVRISCPGPLAVLAGIRETDGARALLFETPIDNAPATRGRFEADGISMLEDRNFADRVYRIVVTLERPDLDNIFGIVSADLIDAAIPLAAAVPAVAALFTRLATWQAFLKARRSGLGRDAVTGLFGELLVLRRLAVAVGWTAAVGAWMGPVGGLHDFLRHGAALEVKSASGVASLIDISSLDQLDDTGLSALLLVHVHLAEAATGFHLPALISEISHEIRQSAPAVLRVFHDVLLASGYADVDNELYLARLFQTLSMQPYLVTSLFPRLTRIGAPQGVVEATYRLDVRAVQPHLVDAAGFEAIMRHMGDPA